MGRSSRFLEQTSKAASESGGFERIKNFLGIGKKKKEDEEKKKKKKKQENGRPSIAEQINFGRNFED